MKKLSGVLILFTGIIVSCQESHPTGKGSSSIDSLAVAEKYLQSIPNQMKLKGAFFSYSQKRQPDIFGEIIPYDSAVNKIKWFSNPANGIGAAKIPVYVEFSLHNLGDNYKKLQEEALNRKIDPEDFHVRCYLSRNKERSTFSSLVFIFAHPDGGNYTDNENLVFNVGSPCPSDCGTGRFEKEFDSTNPPRKGALTASKAYKEEKMNCLLKGAVIGPNSDCESKK